MYRSTFSWPRPPWRWVVSFTPLPLYPRGKIPGAHWIWGWVDPRVDLDDMEKWKFLTPPGLGLRPLGRPASRYTDCYPGPHITDIIRQIKWKMVRWMGYVARMRKIRIERNISVGKLRWVWFGERHDMVLETGCKLLGTGSTGGQYVNTQVSLWIS
jgi:hypothetical protein